MRGSSSFSHNLWKTGYNIHHSNLLSKWYKKNSGLQTKEKSNKIEEI
ncbi:hypothetical protein HMPREF0663_10700 [Hoylesella oralis ATCC 33269]|uniref:Uncharacterized protein n=1 Tax=Hoylesella oralis ATCC 33269 TaxID=873533 RepID=E7RLG6_9BACT|nr:hypothetical protein HMPREF0663_10700 [Hoylesella oralis ATCC 33269]